MACHIVSQVGGGKNVQTRPWRRAGDAVVDDSLSPTFPLGDVLEVYVRREDAERFVEEVRGEDPELASYLRIEERELEAGGRN